MASHVKHVAGIGAALTGLALLTAFVAPFYGALDRTHVVSQSEEQKSQNAAANKGIVVEQFDYEEPSLDGINSNDEVDNKNSPPLEPSVTAPTQQFDEHANITSRESEPNASPVENEMVPDDNQPMRALNMPIATAAGRLESNGQVIELQGIEILPVSETCKSSSGEEWPCGMSARTAFRSWLRSRTVHCRLPDDGEHTALTTECRVGTEDPANWLVTNGWARSITSGPFSEAGKQAEENHLGIFGDKPASALPSFDAGGASTIPSVDGESIIPPPNTPNNTNGYFPPAPPQITPKQ